MPLIRLVSSHVRPYRRWLFALLLLQSVQAILNLYLPNLNADVINKGVLVNHTAYIDHMGVVMLGVTLTQAAFALVAVYLGARIAMSIGRDLRGAVFQRSVQLSTREVNLLGAHSLITRITNDVQQVQLLVVMVCTMVLAAPVTVVGGVIMAFNQNAGMSGLLATSMIVLSVVMGVVIGFMIPQFRVMQERLDNVNRVLREQIQGIRVVRAFVREPQEADRFRTVDQQLTHTSLVAGRLMALMFPIVMLAVNCSSAAVVWVGADRIAAGRMNVGSLVAFLNYFLLILLAVMMATFVTVMAPRAAVSAGRIKEVLDTEPSVLPPEDPVRAFPTPGTLEFRHVSFGYPGAAASVVRDISFSARPGETIAIIGTTGSGKTSMVNLVARLFDPTAGQVLVGGVEIRDLDPDLLWNRIGLVPQHPYLFSGTVASNLRYGRPEATEEEMWAALDVAQASPFVRTMGGLQARINQGGANVSGGQRQRLSIARALVRRPDVYIFDDSFSALDLATEARLRSAMAPYTVGAAVLVVAQRVSTIIEADRILVVDGGELVGSGRHDELLETCPTYAEIVASQNREAAA